jgi:glycosyltransferase involved in cell wall biosynthesis
VKIVHVLAPAPAGGLERVVHALTIGQRRHGKDVAVVPLVDSWSNHPFAPAFAGTDVLVRPLVQPAHSYRSEWAELTAVIRELAPDVVHTHGYHADVIGGGVAHRLNLPVVATVHGFTGGSWKNRVYEQVDLFMLRRLEAVVSVSQPLGDQLRRAGVRAEKLHIIANAWSNISTPFDRASARSQLNLDPNAFVLGWVGRMSREKGLDVFIDALVQLSDLPIQACLIGDGPERSPQTARAAADGTASRLHWAGMLHDAGRFFNAFDAFVLSSRTEGTPMVLFEAMAAGIPLAVTSVGGIPNVVSPGEALIVPPEDPRQLAGAIRAIYADRSAATARAHAALERLERDFSEGPWLSAYDAVYRDAIGRRRR